MLNILWFMQYPPPSWAHLIMRNKQITFQLLFLVYFLFISCFFVFSLTKIMNKRNLQCFVWYCEVNMSLSIIRKLCLVLRRLKMHCSGELFLFRCILSLKMLKFKPRNLKHLYNIRLFWHINISWRHPYTYKDIKKL